MFGIALRQSDCGVDLTNSQSVVQTGLIEIKPGVFVIAIDEIG
jgi:hypothetical protein